MINRTINLMIIVVLCCGGFAQATAWTPLDYPGASKTYLTGISGSNIVGYADGHGVIYNTVTGNWSTLEMQEAQWTEIHGIDGSNYAGKYRDASGEHGFLYDGTNWVTFEVSGDRLTIAGISGQTIAGYYRGGQSADYTKFLYDGTTWTEIAIPLNFPIVYGVDGSNLVGFSGSHGFIYDGANATTFDMPGASWTWLTDIDGDKIVGSSTLGDFLYNRTTNTWTILDTPAIAPLQSSSITGIDGNLIVGSYNGHGFVVTIPEPTAILLLGFGMFVARKN